MAVAFISGHLDLTQAEFDEHYKARIDAAIAAGDSFVIGDARGADAMAQAWLSNTLGAVIQVTVFHAYERPRYHKFGFAVKGGYPSQSSKDRAMTENSDYDILYIRPGKESSGTADNLKRREKFNQQKEESNGRGE